MTSGPTPPFDDYIRIQQQMDAAMRAFQQSGGFDRIVRQTEAAMKALQESGGFDRIFTQAEAATKALQESGGFDRIVRQTEAAMKALHESGGFDRLLQQTEATTRALQAMAGSDALVRQLGEVSRELQTDLPLPEAEVSESARLRRAIRRIDQLILALMVEGARLAGAAAASPALILVGDALGVLLVLRAILAALSSNGDD